MSVLLFENTKTAFAYKTDDELQKAKLLFGLMKYPYLVKIGTAITPWAMKMGLPIKSLIRNTIFKQFVGGESLEETRPVVELLNKYNVKVILDYAVEGGDASDENYDHACDQFLHVLDYASTQENIPFISIKVTGIANIGLLEKLDRSLELSTGTLINRFEAALASLSDKEKKEWAKVFERMNKICAFASEKGVGVLIDAEETWIQDPIDVLAMKMMDTYNKENPIVYNTLQLYRHDRLHFLHDSIEAAEKRKFILAVKLVRGAYMEKERERALGNGYPSPIHIDKDSCDRDFNQALKISLDHINNISLIVASHNDYSNMYGLQLMQEKKLPNNHPHIHFSQLYGMSDHITFNLSMQGCNVSKYLPFGPINEVIPYLMRRAQENTSVAGQTTRELNLLKKESERRKN
ncbi:MAG: proline dehydrogenase family protein [Chitinophagaceae bacterium]